MDKVLPADARDVRRKMKIDKCFSTLGCQNATLEEVAQLASRFRIPLIELRSLEGRMDLPALLASRPGGWPAAKQTLVERGLSVRVLGTSFKLVGNESANWRELFDFASLADALDAPYLRVFGGGKWGTLLTPSEEAQAVRTVREWESGRGARGLRAQILVETHDAFSSSAPCVRLIEQLGEPVHFIWDSHHTWRLGLECPAETWQALAPHIRHVHFKDSIDTPSARHPYTYVLPGTGRMPGLEVRRVLEQGGYSGAVSLEWEKMWHPYLADLPVALEAADASGWW
jgi:sugar phosphate isomerase/epimerase